MIELRPFAEIGSARHGWLDARHHFSFASYHDPDRMGWGRLRVWNDDTIAGGTGFDPHPHHDMEIITYVREGAISHRDSLGNEGKTAAGDVQVMSAGTGIQHSEFNSEEGQCRLFQIWILPDSRGHQPSWGTRPFPKADRSGRFVTLASGMAGDDDALPIHANARVAGAMAKAGDVLRYETTADRHVYLVPTTGHIKIGDEIAQARDGVAITGLAAIEIEVLEDSEMVLVDAA